VLHISKSRAIQTEADMSLEESKSMPDDVADDAVIGRAFKWSLAVILLVASVGGFGYWWTHQAEVIQVKETELETVETRETSALELPKVLFVERGMAESGIDFLHVNGAAGEKLLPETMGGGCAFFDFDGDGDQDLLLVNSREWDDAAEQEPSSLQLYKNDGTGAFTDVTSGSGLEISCYGMGCAVGDYDNDGRVDVYVSAVGSNFLFHNDGNGAFSNVTSSAGVGDGDEDWGTGCGWFDYDRDGDLDLFVVNYLTWSAEYDRAQDFQLTGGERAYGRPQNFEGTFPSLYCNDGDGKFSDVSESAGIQVKNPATGVPLAKSLGVTFADFNGDGWLDVIVANDTVQNLLFRNQQDGTFEEIGALVGVAYDMEGQARGAMGIDAAWFRNDDSIGVAIGNFANEMTALYVTRDEQMQFVDEAFSSGLGPSTRLRLTFGVFYFDADLDGRLDLFAANGHLEQDIHRVQASQTYEQSPQLFWNCGAQEDTEFMPLTIKETGESFAAPLVGRGASFADVDLDGDLDMLITTVGQRPRLLINEQQQQHHWLRVKLVGKQCPRDAIGSVVELTVDGTIQRRQVMPTRSYLSQVELPVTFGLGEHETIEKLKIHWADGTKQVIDPPEVDQLVTIEQAVDVP